MPKAYDVASGVANSGDGTARSNDQLWLDPIDPGAATNVSKGAAAPKPRDSTSRRFGSNLAAQFRSRERPESLRVIRRLPVTWQCVARGGRASDKPRGRKPRAGMDTTVRRAGTMGI